MSARWRPALYLIAALTINSACGGPPDKEMQQAQSAIDAARSGGGDRYAREELVAAEEALKHARDAAGDHDYRLALNHALDSRERAQGAAAQVAGRKAAAQAAAERALTDASTALADAQVKLKAAEAARLPPAKLAGPRRAIANEERAVQEARTAFSQGDYLAVPGSMSRAAAHLRETAGDLDAMAPSAPRRRR